MEEVLDSTLSRRVDLPSGGYLMIDYAEALTVIDVNSGSFIGRGTRRQARGHDHQDQPRGRGRGRATAAAPRHRRDHRHRLHRHGAGPQSRRRPEDAAQGARRGPDEDVRGRDLAAGTRGDDPPERDRRRPRDHDPPVPHVPRRGRDQVRGDDRDRVRAPDARPREAHLGRGAADPDEPARQRRVHRQRGPGAAHDRGADRASGSCSRARRGCRWITSRCCSRATATRCSSVPCRSARAKRSTSRSSSRTCTAPATRSRRSTATSSRSRGGTPYVGEKHLVRIEEVGRTSARASLVDVPASGADGRRRLRGRIGRWPRIKASAPRPQRRTAPFRCKGRVCLGL